MRFEAVLFDLDGTLLDTLADIANSANAVLKQHGFAPYPVDAYRHLVGEGVRRLFERGLPEEARTPETVERCAEAFGTVYGRGWNIHSRPYDGVIALLDELTARRLPLAVLSNKPHEFAVRCVQEYFSDWSFRAVLGQRDGVPRKPEPAAAREIVEQVGLPAERFVYLGDTAIDVQTARNAGMHPVGAAWGYRSIAELRAAGATDIIRHPNELVAIIDRSADA